MTLPSTRPETEADTDAPSAEELRRRVKQLRKEHKATLDRMPRRIQLHLQWLVHTRDAATWNTFEKSYPERIRRAATFDPNSPQARAACAETLDNIQHDMREHAARLATA